MSFELHTNNISSLLIHQMIHSFHFKIALSKLDGHHCCTNYAAGNNSMDPFLHIHLILEVICAFNELTINQDLLAGNLPVSIYNLGSDLSPEKVLTSQIGLTLYLQLYQRLNLNITNQTLLKHFSSSVTLTIHIYTE